MERILLAGAPIVALLILMAILVVRAQVRG